MALELALFCVAMQFPSGATCIGFTMLKIGLVIRLIYAFYSYSLIFISVSFIILELITFRKSFGDTTLFVSQIGMMFTHLIGMGKLWILVYNREKIDQIKAKLQDKQYRYTPLDDFQPGLKMHQAKLVSVFLAIFIFLLYTCVGVSAHISAVVTVKKNTIGEVFINNSTCEAFTPYYYYYPFDRTTATGCYYSLAYMDISLDISAWYIATLDMVFFVLLHYLTTQLNILGHAFTTIRKRCLRKMNLDSNINIFNDTSHPGLENEMYNEMTRCTKHLYLLVEVMGISTASAMENDSLIRKDIEDVFTFITLAQTLASLLIFASCLFVAARVPVNSPNFFAQIEYFSAVLTQFSIFCWFGNQMTLAGEALPNALYNSDWFASSPRFKKSMLLTMARMQRPLFVSIGKFTPLALTTLLGVIQGSFSYFTVFQSVGSAE